MINLFVLVILIFRFISASRITATTATITNATVTPAAMIMMRIGRRTRAMFRWCICW